jgi:hypothetical protein
VTRDKFVRYCIVRDRAYAWRWVTLDGRVLEQSSGRFYDNMDPAPPTYRKHHPRGIVEAALAVRRRCSYVRRIIRGDFSAMSS